MYVDIFKYMRVAVSMSKPAEESAKKNRMANGTVIRFHVNPANVIFMACSHMISKQFHQTNFIFFAVPIFFDSFESQMIIFDWHVKMVIHEIHNGKKMTIGLLFCLHVVCIHAGVMSL